MTYIVTWNSKKSSNYYIGSTLTWPGSKKDNKLSFASPKSRMVMIKIFQVRSKRETKNLPRHIRVVSMDRDMAIQKSSNAWPIGSSFLLSPYQVSSAPQFSSLLSRNQLPKNTNSMLRYKFKYQWDYITSTAGTLVILEV